MESHSYTIVVFYVHISGFTGWCDVFLTEFRTQIRTVQIWLSNQCFSTACVLHLLNCSIDWSAVVVDEAHKIKNPNAQITQAMKDLRCEVRWLCVALSTSEYVNNMASHTEPLYTFSSSLSWSGQDWPYWHHLTEQPGGVVVCHGLVCSFIHNIGLLPP